MGRFSEPLATEFVALLGLRDGDRVLDVGCGPGALTRLLVQRLGAAAVSAVDPSESFVTAVRERIPGIEVYRAAAEDPPFADDRFDCAAAQLVVHFMTDPVAGLAEMARVTLPGGMVAACVWDHGTAAGPLSMFWRACRRWTWIREARRRWPAPVRVSWLGCSSRPGCTTWSPRC